MKTDYDVIVVGAGISGIGAGVHLQKHCPERSYLILEGRDSIGGTWDLFRYPGIRSDSDMYTLGYNFKPWTEQKAIADGPSIIKYLDETAREYGIYEKIRYRHHVDRASWDSDSARWNVTATHGGEKVRLTCNFLYLCAGYYNYEHGYTPEFADRDSFKGKIVHPQFWPQDLDYRNKKVVVIGSGATAVTLIPSMAADTAHITMLQRSPTYMISRPAEDAFANRLRDMLPAWLAYAIVRWRNVLLQMWLFNISRSRPRKVRAYLINAVREKLGPGYDVDRHFKPYYNPWEQRLCLVPDDDLFDAIKSGKADVVTDHIDRFTERGILLKSGRELEADIIVTATGLDLLMVGGVDIFVDGRQVDFSRTFGYKGMMYSDVPNLASAVGYTNASWTLKADLTSEYVCRLLNHMKKTGTDIATPVPRDVQESDEPWLDLSAGYVERAAENFPKKGDRLPWKLYQNYAKDLVLLRYRRVDDGEMVFAKAGQAGEEMVNAVEALAD